MSSGDTQSPPESGAEPDSATPSTGPSAGSHQTTSSSSQSQNTFDTQPPSSQDQPEDHVDTQAWGQLTIIGSNSTHDLIKDSYIVGRGDQCDFLLRDKTPPTKQSSLWKACSKQHFKIYVETKSTGRYIFIQDLSSNGTIVNKELVGKGRFTVLKQGDVISLVKKDWRAYMFMDVGAKDESKGLPEAIKSKYLFIKELGRGACGQVMLAICRESKVRVACKCIEKQSFSFSRSNKDLMKEVRIILQLNHPCVIKVVDVIDTEETLYILMELVEGGDLFELIKTSVRLEPECVKFIFYQMCLAIKHLHDNHIVHRDLKPENIMLTSIVPGCQMAKVTDFGLSNMVETSSLLKSLCGTPFYVAPEVVETSGMGTGYTKAVDCWSLGVILFVCITGGPAFTTQRKDMELRDQILTGNYALKDKYWEHLPQAKDLVQKLLTVDPKQRFTVDQALTHPWFTEDPEMLQQVTKLIEEENSSISTPPALNLLPESVLNTPEAKRRKLMDTKENRSDASTPLLRQPSAANSAMSRTSAPDDSGVPPSDDMDTITSTSSSKMSTTS